MRTNTRRLGALVAASAITATGLTLLATPAQAATQPRPVEQGASWLVGQLTNGLIHSPNYSATGYDDYGLSIDAALALDEIGGHAADVTAIGNAIRERYYSYTTGVDYGDPASYAGGIAKALVLAQVANTGPVRYQATLRTDLESQTSSTAPIAGRIENDDETVYLPPSFDPAPGDTANVISQGLAARALTVAGSSEAPAAVAFLLEQQCTAGFFRETFTADKAAVDQSCDGAVPAADPSIDSTSEAVINLQAISDQPGVAAALASARTWIKAQQALDGSFNGGNANSTGLAAWALGASPEATRAADWIRDHQANDTDACTRLGAGNVGAIALDDAGLAGGRANGIPTTRVDNLKQDEFRRATTQALPALQFVSTPAPATLKLTGPTGYVQAGRSAAYQVSGASSQVCLTVGSSSRLVAAAGGSLAVPAGTANRAAKVVDRDGNAATALTKVLGSKKLAVKPAARSVKKGTKVVVTVSGLAAGESVTLRYRGAVVATGKANVKGTLVRKIAVGKKTGKATIAAFGQFSAIRKGATTITVRR